MKRVLMLNASHNDLRAIKALKELGYYVITTGNRPTLIGHKLADEYICGDYSDKEKILKLAVELKLDAICACCNDFGVLTAAYVAEKLSLPGHDTYKNALILHHKDQFKEFSREYGIRTPLAESFDDVDAAAEWVKNAEYPIIIKPVDLSAGRGITRADTYEEATSAIRKAFSQSRAGHIIIEPFIEGTQHACCTFLINKKVVAYCTNNEYSFVNPYRVEIDTYPADNFESVRDILISEAEKMARLLNLSDGILSMQYLLRDGEPHIMEVMRRILGNMYMVPASDLNGFNWDYWETRARCGMGCNGFPTDTEQKGFFAYRVIQGYKNGKVANVVVPEEFSRFIYNECVLWESGYVIEDYMSEPLGILFFKFSTREEMMDVMLNKYRSIYVEYV